MIRGHDSHIPVGVLYNGDRIGELASNLSD